MSTDVDKRARQIHVNDYGSDKSIFRSSAHTDKSWPGATFCFHHILRALRPDRTLRERPSSVSRETRRAVF